MKVRPVYELPPEKQQTLKRAIRLEWISICFLISIAVIMYLAMGTSQAMKTAWVEDVLSIVPPVAFLIAMRVRNRPPTEMHPYGFRRAVLLAFLVAAVAVLVVGLWILYEAMHSLLTQRHPTIGHIFSSAGRCGADG